jgi:hypothetical protein
MLLLFLSTLVPASDAVSVGVKPGDKVSYGVSIYGNLSIFGVTGLTVPPINAADIEVKGVSGSVINFTATVTFQNGTNAPPTYSTMNLSTNTFGLWIIPAGLNKDDPVGLGPGVVVNETRNEIWLKAKRTVCYFAFLSSTGVRTVNVTGHYDQKTGICFSFFVGVLEDSVVKASFAMTIQSASMIAGDYTPPSISNVVYDPQKPQPNDAVTVSANVIDTESGVKAVTLLYTTGEDTWTSLPMSLSMGSNYTATIPKQSDGTIVEFKVKAEDNVGNTVESAVGSYTVKALIFGMELAAFCSLVGVLVIVVALIVVFLFTRRRKAPTPSLPTARTNLV